MGAETHARKQYFRTSEPALGALLVSFLLLLTPASTVADLRHARTESARIGPDGLPRKVSALESNATSDTLSGAWTGKSRKVGNRLSLKSSSGFQSSYQQHRAQLSQQPPGLDTSDLQNQAKDAPMDKIEVNPWVWLMFTQDAGGAWDGYEQELSGEYGFAFTPHKEMNLTWIGRQAPGSFDHGYGLRDKTNVTVWMAPPPGREDDYKTPADYMSLKVVSEEVGPDDSQCCGQKYQMHKLNNSVLLFPNVEYRITQSCFKGMPDKWFNHFSYETDISQYALVECFTFGHGVHSDKRFSYPTKVDMQYKRIGMMNLRVETWDGCGTAIPEEGGPNAGWTGDPSVEVIG